MWSFLDKSTEAETCHHSAKRLEDVWLYPCQGASKCLSPFLPCPSPPRHSGKKVKDRSFYKVTNLTYKSTTVAAVWRTSCERASGEAWTPRWKLLWPGWERTLAWVRVVWWKGEKWPNWDSYWWKNKQDFLISRGSERKRGTKNASKVWAWEPGRSGVSVH